MKILVVSWGDTAFPFHLEENVSRVKLWPYRTLAMRLLVRLCFLLGIAGWIFEWRFRGVDFSAYDCVVVNQLNFPAEILQSIRRKAPETRLVYLLWDTLYKLRPPRFYDARKETEKLLLGREKWKYTVVSFDRADCVKYGLRYGRQFAPRPDISGMSRAVDTDVFFCGQDKNRLDAVKDLGKQFAEQGVSFTSWLFPMRPKTVADYAEEDRKFLREGKDSYPQIPYEEIVQGDLRAKAILDLVQEGQHGITWRPLEALFYRKKLLTNFSEIKEYDFYRKENIFVMSNWGGVAPI